MSFLSIASLNVNGLRNDLKRNVLFDYLYRRKISLIFLQETHSEPNDEPEWCKQWQGKMYFSHGNRQSRGVAILTSDKVSLNITNIVTDDEGRCIKAQMIWNDNTFFIASIYAPNQIYDRTHFFDDLSNQITGFDNWIVGGDFNCNLDNKQIKDVSKIVLNNVLQEKDLIDSWRTVHPDKEGYTHFHKGSKQANRIDYIFVSYNLINNVNDVSVTSCGLSDHQVICLKIDDIKTPHGQGRWFCNNSLLEDSECIARITKLWDFWKSQKLNYNTLSKWWETGKFRLKEIVQEYGKEKARTQKQNRKELQKRYDFLIKNTDSINKVDQIKKVEAELKHYEINEWKKVQFRIRNTQKEEGEKASKFFLSLEKQQIRSCKIDKLFNQEGILVDQPDTMLNIANDFYSNLYNSENLSKNHLDKIASNIKSKTIPDSILKDLERQISEEEIKNALFQMNKNKSPGIDGLTVEFYQAFWHILGEDILEVYNECFTNGFLSNSMNTALVKLIYKNSGSRYELKNWRPISLLTVDYKILSKAITNRLKPAMPLIIGEEQSCGVPHRNIHENLMVLRDTIDYVNWENLEAAVVSIDQEKAFDRINWEYMFCVMNKMNLPPTFLKWIELFYSKPNCRIILNNFIGSPVQIGRGIRQGCPLSPLLYAICAEGLACLIRNNNNLRGIATPKGETCVKLVQHADDTNIFIGDENEFDILENTLDTYCKGSGSKLNVHKSKGLWLGKWKPRQDKPCLFNWCKDKIKILGITFGNEVTPEDNWSPRINKIQCVLDKWSKRNLTYMGKTVIVNTFVGASINYLGSVIACPAECVKKINTIIWNFFWNGKCEKIKRDTVTGPKQLGGTGLVDIQCKITSLKLNWLARYFRTDNKWKFFFDHWINKASRNNNLGWYIFANDKTKIKTTPFYEELITAFQEAGGKLKCNFSSILETREVPIFNNSIATRDNVFLDSPLLKSNGMTKIKDVTKKGNLISFKTLATKCSIKNINAGRIVGRLKEHIDFTLLQ